MTTHGSNPTAAKLRGLVSRCSVCSADLSRHRFAQIASTVATEDNKRSVQELLGHVRQHEWDALTIYKDFRGDQNAVLVYSITGPHSGGMVILIRDPFELYEPAELYLQEQLSSDEVAAVTALAPAEDWQEF
jgi:hypothetical protein